ncbi:rab GTPase-activating protein 1-like [Malaya genurostris]|uniref:rab GTPase-activating protein 1-like n=1 Tax=Malaya genurostris TaxID=325434 RepID=UPI0026F37EB3|nr:rab GTPase-activating protein 1-like [Malaya genurostris]XP_058459278.1 rab GTPase-activating protein 1-like [Malaya genurostris]XP_058459279.1 rab GTPase-activating protein 1-like [Malaya genurostris]XP_058459280.1 rab GTPase-activating protein 1-like [Malaya genurostris]
MEHGQNIDNSATKPTKSESMPFQLGSVQKTDDNLSIKSSDSVTTSGEYEMVPDSTSLVDVTDGACSTLHSPTVNTAKNQQEPKHDLKQTGELNLTDCFEEDEVVVNLIAATPAKLEPISPILNIEGNGNVLDLEKNMDEVIHELDEERTLSASDGDPGSANKTPVKCFNSAGNPKGTVSQICLRELKLRPPTGTSGKAPNLQSPENRVGQSVFYDCLDSSPMTEKKDIMKPDHYPVETDDEELSDIDQECTIFSGVSYLGATGIKVPKSEKEILQKVAEMQATSSVTPLGMKISVSIPTRSEGLVVLYDGETNAVVATYEVQRILFFARGPAGTPTEACFAFTWSHGESQETASHQCHVFRCNIPEAVSQVSACFAKAFQRALPPSIPASMTTSLADSSLNVMVASITSDSAGNPIQSAMYEFNVSLEIKEKEKSGYTTVPRDAKSSFRLRCNTDKEVCIVVKQIPSEHYPPLLIERCFGVLLSPGKIVRQADMQLLDMVNMGYVKPEAPSAPTNPMTTSMASLSAASTFSQLPYQIRAEWKANDKAFEQLNTETQKKCLTVAVDLVIKGIQEPVRFVIETSVMILSQSELRIMQNLFTNKRLLVMQYYLTLRESGEGSWEVESIDHSDEIVEQIAPGSLSLNLNFKTWTFKTSASVQSMEFDDSSPDYSSDGDEPLLSGTGEVSKECSSALLDDWNEILVEWDRDNLDKRPRNLASLVRCGIPDILRGTIWQKLANVENKTEMTDSYRVLITKETSCENVIQRDINRTFPAHKFFKESGGMGQDSLYKVSKAYAVYDTEVGYCQGLSFIAASLLLHMPEEEAFSVLVALMYNYGLRDMYKLGFESLYLRLYQLNRLMKDQLPDLYEHFYNTGIESHMFASQWFLTLFTARFPLYFVFYILDVFLLDGITVLFQVALTLLSVCKKDLLELDFEGILKYFRVTLPKKCRSENQAKRLMKLSFECKVKKLKKFELEYLAKKEESERKEREMKQYELKFNEERTKMKQEIVALNVKLETMVRDEKKNTGIIVDYKQIIQRQEQENNKLHQMLEDLTKTVSLCSKCSSSIPKSSPLHKSYGKNLQNSNSENNNDQNIHQENNLGPLDPLLIATQRIRELELELAQTKLAQVEAECKVQDLHHQLNSTLTDMQTHRNSWQPWFSKTLNSIQEKVVTRRDVNAPTPTFQSYTDSSVKLRDHHSQSFPAQVQLRNKLHQRHSLTQVPFEAAGGVGVATRHVSVGEPPNENVLFRDSAQRCNSLK